jgi:outer membrane protein OmpA-like peptidoglycan-associated protein
VVNGSGESKESKELSYTAVEDKIGLIYWKVLFDESMEYHKSNTAGIRQGINATPERVVESENIKATTVPAETVTDHNLLASKKMILKIAEDLSSSDFYIFFKQNSNELSLKAIGKLDRIYEILTGNSASKLKLNGYSDSSGAPSYNQMLSEIRALSVKSYLTGKGIKPSRIMALGHGAQKFIASNKIAEGRGLNRRVEIEIITP